MSHKGHTTRWQHTTEIPTFFPSLVSLYLFFLHSPFAAFQAFVSGKITEVHFSVSCFSAGGLENCKGLI